ncbi:Trigger factor [Gammaproteobacteria bacterium]
MQVSVETTQGLERRFNITIPGKDIEQEQQKRLKSLAQTMRIAGFRPGKVPMPLIQNRFGPQVRKEVMDELIKSTLGKVFYQEKLRVVGGPLLEPIAKDPPDGDLHFTATFEVYPDVELAPLTEVVVNQAEVQIDEADVDQMQERFHHKYQTWTQVDRPAALGDRVRIDFAGTLADGTSFPGGSGNDVVSVLGAGMFLEEFEQHLVGALAGETRSVDITFPSDYHHPEVAGRSARFAVTVKRVEGGQLPELNEAFIRQNFGIAEGTVEALRDQIRQGMKREFEGKVWQLLKIQLLDALCQHNPIELPNTLVEIELNRLRAELPKDAPPNPELEEQARRRVTLGILAGDIVQRQRLKPDISHVRAYIRAAARDYDNPEEVERWYFADDSRLQEVEALLLEDMVAKWLLGQVQVKVIPTPFSALIDPTRVGYT